MQGEEYSAALTNLEKLLDDFIEADDRKRRQ